jgi:2-methylcitrate dehydratase PrpD
LEGSFGFEDVFGGAWAPDRAAGQAIDENWIKPWPCCLMAHSAIEAAVMARQSGLEAPAGVTVTVHPRARSAAAYDEPGDGLEAKFSIPYLVALTLLRGEPTVASFAQVDAQARALAADRVRLELDAELGETEAVLQAGQDELARVAHSLGSPARPMGGPELEAKVHDLAGERLEGALDDDARPAADLLAATGILLG